MDRRELLRTFALASEFKEGDLAVGGTPDDLARAEARRLLAELRLGDISRTVFVNDELSETLARASHKMLSREIASIRVGSVKRILLSGTAKMWWQNYRDGLSSEMIAAVVKLMTNEELSDVARIFSNPSSGAVPDDTVTIGSARHLGSCIQANNPRDDEEEILFSILEGLSYGCGDVLISLNPAKGDVETTVRLGRLLAGIIEKLKLPTRFCVMTGIKQQAQAGSSTKLDVVFQSLAGTSKALRAMAGLDAEGLVELALSFDGLCFEAGQGSELLSDASEDVDMATLEARAFGLARCIKQQVEQRQQRPAWTVVCSLVGLNSRQAFRSPEQMTRAGLESVVTAKLHGLVAGLDVCTTFQSGIDPDALRQLTAEIAEQASPAFLNAIPGNADPLLGHLTTSFREHPAMRRATGKQITSVMQERLSELGTINDNGEPVAHALTTARLYAQYKQSEGDARGIVTLQAEGLNKLERIKQQGFDLGYGQLDNYAAPQEVERRLEAIHSQARRGRHAKSD